MHQHRDGIQTSLTETKVHLDKLHDEIGHTLEKISSREKYLNNQLEHLLHDFRMAQDQFAETKEKYRQASGGVTERSRILAEVYCLCTSLCQMISGSVYKCDLSLNTYCFYTINN